MRSKYIYWIAFRVFAFSSLLVGCSDRQFPYILESMNVKLDPLPGCLNPGPPVAVVRLVLPGDLKLTGLSRRVFTKAGDNDTSAGDGPTQDGGGYDGAEVGSGAEPLHIHVGKMDNFPRGLIRVRVIIPPNSDYRFKRQMNGVTINGIGAGQSFPDTKKMLCNTRRISEPGNRKEVATFFIDENVNTDPNYRPSFNIVVYARGSPETPIIIDPKVHDSGINAHRSNK